MIKPTVGRMIHFHPASNKADVDFVPTAICAAIVCAVNDDGTVNLSVFDSAGRNHTAPGVPIIDEGELVPEEGYYATWMPYQNQVAKGEIPPTLHATGGTMAAVQKDPPPSPFSDANKPVEADESA